MLGLSVMSAIKGSALGGLSIKSVVSEISRIITPTVLIKYKNKTNLHKNTIGRLIASFYFMVKVF